MTVHYSVNRGVATVRIDRPEVLNALNRPTLEALRDSFRRASADHGVGVVVLTGTGDRAFCTGADLGEQEAFLERPNDYWDWMGRFIEAIEAITSAISPPSDIAAVACRLTKLGSRTCTRHGLVPPSLTTW